MEQTSWELLENGLLELCAYPVYGFERVVLEDFLITLFRSARRTRSARYIWINAYTEFSWSPSRTSHCLSFGARRGCRDALRCTRTHAQSQPIGAGCRSAFVSGATSA